jgi:hypothetical protein
MRTLVAFVALGLGLLGCDDDKPVTHRTTGPLVVYEHGGGFASQPRDLEIDRQGHARLSVRTGADLAKRTFDLSPAQLDELEGALDDAAGAAQPGPTGCADCFTYTIHADGIDLSLDQVSIEDAPDPVGRLVTLLEDLSGP